MPISVKCSCGKALRVKDEHAGKKIRCPACQQTLKVPVPEEEIPEVEVEMEEPAADDQITERRPPKVPARTKSRAAYDEEEEEDDEPPRRKKKRSKKKHELQKMRWDHRDITERTRNRERPWIAISPAIITGVLMMIGAVVWFVAGLAFGILFIYPPILFVLGIIAVIKGFMGQDD